MALSLLIAPIVLDAIQKIGLSFRIAEIRRAAWEPVEKLLNHLREVIGNVVGQPADPNVAGIHAGAGRFFKDVEDALANIKGIEEATHHAHVKHGRPKPREVARDPL